VTETKKKETGLRDAGDMIRKAWRAGKRTITIDGVEFYLFEQVKKFRTREDGKKVEFTESWIIANPVDKRHMVPVYSVEKVAGKNSRVRLNTQEQ
jgi:hypothetical protein